MYVRAGAAVVVALALAAIGCAAQSEGPRWTRIDQRTFRVSYHGDKWTSEDAVANGALLRCAELTLWAGYSHFVVISERARSHVDTVQLTPDTYRSHTQAGFLGGYSAAGEYRPGAQIHVTRHGAVVMFRALTPEEAAAAPGAYSAHEIVQYLGPHVRGY